MKLFKWAAIAALFCVAVNVAHADCPRFVEFLPDPVDTTDDAGEYVEIRLAGLADTLFVRFEDKPEMAFENTYGRRLLLHRDTLFCSLFDSLDCRLLSGVAIPNSREMTWTLRQGSCADTVRLPAPKPGKSLQLDDYSGDWVYSKNTPGVPCAEYELGVDDCGITLAGAVYKNGFYEIALRLTNCDSALVHYQSETQDLAARKYADSVFVHGSSVVKVKSGGMPERFVAFVPPDEIALNDTLDTLLIAPENSPLYFTEVHYCPEEGNEEWVELYNGLPRALALKGFSFCGRGKMFADSVTLLPFESALVTRDTLALRSEIGFSDAKILKASFGALKNTADTLALCYGEDTLDVVTFGKETASVCPMGYNPRTGRKENTPGFQSRGGSKHGVPFTVELSSRSVSLKERVPIRVRIGSGDAIVENVRLVLVAERGRTVYEESVIPNDNLWLELPVLGQQPGVYFLKCNVGRYEKSYGIIVRP